VPKEKINFKKRAQNIFFASLPTLPINDITISFLLFLKFWICKNKWAFFIIRASQYSQCKYYNETPLVTLGQNDNFD